MSDTRRASKTVITLMRRLAAEKALADDLAAVLASIRLPYFARYPNVERVLARYREARK